MHDVVVVGIPLIAILAGILFSRNDARDLRNEMKDVRGELKELRNEVREELRSVRSEMRAIQSETRDHLNRIDADLRQFYHLTGSLEARVDSIDKR